MKWLQGKRRLKAGFQKALKKKKEEIIGDARKTQRERNGKEENQERY